MAKSKKQNRKNSNHVSVTPSALAVREPFWTPRRCTVLSLAALAVMWLIQFFPVLAGGAHFWEDIVLNDYPARVFARSAILSGEFPHWMPYAFNGMPFFALQSPGVLYPFNFILSLLPVSDGVFWYLIQTCLTLHFLIAGVCMFVYLRYKRRSFAASFFGSAAFMLGGFLVTHLIHTMMVYILTWFPLVLLLYERSIREIKFPLAVLGGLLLGVTMLAGHPQISFYEILLLLSIGVFLLCQLKDNLTKRVFAGAVFFAVAGGLCLVQYLPTIEMNAWTVRTDYTINDASEGSLQFVQLLTALAPKVFGAYTGSAAAPAFWLTDSFRHGYYNYWETCFYFGVSTLLLTALWFGRNAGRRTFWFALAWVVGSLCVALGGNFFVFRALFAMGVPGFTEFRHPARILLTWGILFPLVAAFALDGLNDLKRRKPKIVLLSICAAFLLIGIVIAAGGMPAFFPQLDAAPAIAAYASQQGFLLLINAALVSVIFILFFVNKINSRTAKILIAACLAVDMLSFAAGHHIKTDGGGAPAAFKASGSNSAMIRERQKKEFFRFSMRQFDLASETSITKQTPLMLMDKNQGLVDNIQLVEGYTALRLKHFIPPLDTKKFCAFLDLLNVKYYVNPDFKQGDDVRDVMQTNTTYLPRAKLFYKAQVVGHDDNDSLVLAYMNGDSYDHHNEIVTADFELARFIGGQVGKGKVNIVNYKLNKIELDVDTDREAILWLSEIWYPAWKATVNGERAKVHRANYSFRAVVVPAGQSKVVFKFDSGYFNAGAFISLLTLIAAVTYLLAVLYRRRGGTSAERRGGIMPSADSAGAAVDK